MSFDGTHYICAKHKEEKYYSDVTQSWICSECEIENSLNK